ncbi:hypothetical protein Cgig2_029902 [Carnegiea gigantea]|uniref:Uncharacterized protein n=1 Tax=Carnegiea gigantea TaxID=171969 RepID=A0A9Q1GIJ7_9CARY|nr:hypothetical protein Cgig2_029902 [Carnegiea gigantea]
MKSLQDYKEKKRQKTKIARDMEDEITRSFNRNDYVDDEEEEDAQLAHARYQSSEQHRFKHDQRVYRANKGTYYDKGGGNRPPSVPQMRRSTSIFEKLVQEDQGIWHTNKFLNPAARLRAVEAFGSWIINTNMPFTMVDSIYTNPLLETIHEVGPNVRAPSSYQLSDVYLSDISQIPSQDWEDREVRTRVQNVIMRLEPDVDKQIKAMRQVAVDQQPQDMQGRDCKSEGHWSPSSSHGGSGGGGDGGNGGANEMGASYSSRLSTDYFTHRGRGVTVEDDRRSRRSPDEQPREPIKTYRRVRKGPGLFAPLGGYDTYGGVLNNYGYSSTNTNCPPPSYPSHELQFVGPDSSRRHRDNPPIINQETINHGDHHYHQPIFYSGNSTSSEQSWMNSTTS